MAHTITKLLGCLQVGTVEPFFTRSMYLLFFVYVRKEKKIRFFDLGWKENDPVLLDFPKCHVSLDLTKFL